MRHNILLSNKTSLNTHTCSSYISIRQNSLIVTTSLLRLLLEKLIRLVSSLLEARYSFFLGFYFVWRSFRHRWDTFTYFASCWCLLNSITKIYQNTYRDTLVHKYYIPKKKRWSKILSEKIARVATFLWVFMHNERQRKRGNSVLVRTWMAVRLLVCVCICLNVENGNTTKFTHT